MKRNSYIPFVLALIGGLILQILLGMYLVEEWVFMDSHTTTFEQIMYLIAVTPPFLISLFFFKETQKFARSLIYSIFFYLVSFTLVTLYHYVPHSTNYASGDQIDLGSYGFYVTGGGVGALSVLPHILLTAIVLFAIYKYSKK